MSDKIRLLGMSDPITFPTGFARVARELFSRLAEDERYDLGYISPRWVGTRHWPTIKTYVGTDEFCQDQFPVAALDFAGETEPYVLWTLNDPWQVGWIVNPGDNSLSTHRSAAFWRDHRKRTIWVGHFPIDGWGPMGGPPLWTEAFLNGPDVTVFMADFGRRVAEKLMKKPWRVIPHAIDTTVFQPLDKDQAKVAVERIYLDSLAKTISVVMKNEDGSDYTEEQVAKEIERRRLRLEGHFTVLVVMGNRERKLWPQVLEAFKGLLEEVPDARLVAICGDRLADKGGDWPILEYARLLKLERKTDPVAWIFDSFGRMPWEEDQAMSHFYSAADATLLLSTGEGFGLPQLESHACGTPCVVGRYSASEEQVVDQRELVDPRGYVYAGTNMVKRPVYRVRDVVAKLVYAAKHPEWRLEAGMKGVERAKKHDWSVILPQWKSLFEEVWAGGTEGR